MQIVFVFLFSLVVGLQVERSFRSFRYILLQLNYYKFATIFAQQMDGGAHMPRIVSNVPTRLKGWNAWSRAKCTFNN